MAELDGEDPEVEADPQRGVDVDDLGFLVAPVEVLLPALALTPGFELTGRGGDV